MFRHKQLMLITAALLLAFGAGSISPTVSIAQERGLESLKQTGQAFRSVAKKVSPAERAGFRRGSLIVEIDRKKVTMVKQAMSFA